MAEAMLPEEIEAVGGLLDALAGQGFAQADVDGRTQIFHAFCDQDPDAKLGLHPAEGPHAPLLLRPPGRAGENPNWEAIGYPGPESPPPSPAEAPKTITIEEVSGPSRRRSRPTSASSAPAPAAP